MEGLLSIATCNSVMYITARDCISREYRNGKTHPIRSGFLLEYCMKEIVVVAPFISMTEVTQSVVAENGYSNVDLLEGNLWDGVESAKRAVSGGAKVIISRGGTFELIKAELDIPVVEVKVTAFDLKYIPIQV
jgi:hypothetical protein